MEITWKKGEITQRLMRLCDTLIEIAMEDDIISDDEQALIDVMKKHVMDVEDQFALMIDQQKPVDEVIKQTKVLFERAIEATAREARKDGTITADELILIDRVAKSLRREDLTKYFES